MEVAAWTSAHAQGKEKGKMVSLQSHFWCHLQVFGGFL